MPSLSKNAGRLRKVSEGIEDHPSRSFDENNRSLQRCMGSLPVLRTIAETRRRSNSSSNISESNSHGQNSHGQQFNSLQHCLDSEKTSAPISTIKNEIQHRLLQKMDRPSPNRSFESIGNSCSPKTSPKLSQARLASIQSKMKSYGLILGDDDDDVTAKPKYSILPTISPRASPPPERDIKKKKTIESANTFQPLESQNDISGENNDLYSTEQDLLVHPFDFDSDFDLTTPLRPKYNPSPYQRYILSKLLPPEGGEMSNQKEFTVCKGYALVAAKFVDFKAINDTLNLLISTYPILTTKFNRNPNIIDADVECFLMYNAAETLRNGNFITQMQVEKSQVEETINNWRKTSIRASSNPFSLLLLEFDKTKVMEYHRVLVFGASVALIDNISLNWIVNRFFQLLSVHGEESAQDSLLKSLDFEESVSFELITDQEQFEETDFKFWKSQCVVLSENSIEIGQQLKLERDIRFLEKETSNLKYKLHGAEEKSKLLTEKLAKIKKKRLDLTAEVDDSNQLEIVCDPVTLNPVYMTKASKAALLSSALNNAEVTEHFMEWLRSNNLSETILEKLGENMVIDDFLLLSDFHCSHYNLDEKDKKQLLAFVESCKNKVKEGLDDVQKIKSSLEREIHRLTRAIGAHTDLIIKAKNKIISNEKKAFEISAIVNPEVVVKFIPTLSSKAIEDIIEFDENASTTNSWDTLRFFLRKDIIDNLSTFSVLESPNDSIRTCALAAFGIFLKHSTGQELFLIGLETSIRPEGLFIGPLSDTLPIQFDFSSPDLTISELCNNLQRIHTATKSHSVCCPRSFFEGADLSIQFQYYSMDDLKLLESLGTTAAELCQLDPVNEKHGRIHIRRVYKADTRDNYNIRLTVIQKSDDEVECLFTYRRDKFERERMEKYAEKFSVTLESFNDNRRKVSIATVLARYHNPLYSQASFKSSGLAHYRQVRRIS